MRWEGRRLSKVTLIGGSNCEALAFNAGSNLSAEQVARALEGLVIRHRNHAKRRLEWSGIQRLGAGSPRRVKEHDVRPNRASTVYVEGLVERFDGGSRCSRMDMSPSSVQENAATLHDNLMIRCQSGSRRNMDRNPLLRVTSNWGRQGRGSCSSSYPTSGYAEFAQEREDHPEGFIYMCMCQL